MKPFHVFYWLIVASAMAGCAGPRPVMPAPYTVVISADANINQDSQGRPTPVQVRLLELRNSSNFERMDFFTLYEKDTALGSDLLAKEQMMLQPGQSVTLNRKANVDAQTLGVFVAFRDVTRGYWRAVAPLPQSKELWRWNLGIFNPSFDSAYVNIIIGPQSVTAQATGTAPASTYSSGGLPQVNTPSLPSVPSAPSYPSVPSVPSYPSVPSAPSYPSVPGAPSAPSVPNMAPPSIYIP
jgi:type VI secretion system protein VasD